MIFPPTALPARPRSLDGFGHHEPAIGPTKPSFENRQAVIIRDVVNACAGREQLQVSRAQRIDQCSPQDYNRKHTWSSGHGERWSENRGRYGFDGGIQPRDACRAPSTRKSDGTNHNCGYAARSRRLIRRRRSPRLCLRGGKERHTAGWPEPGASTGHGEIF